MTARRPMARRGERGFALLLIFAMAAAMAVLLYMEMPRVVFEGQRNKEQLLIERGEQYKRAIQVYYRKNKKLPQRIEDLERGTETRFLRHRYKDPFTGKDDWKLIETDGVNLKNSLVKKPQAALGQGGRNGLPAESLTQQQQQQQQQQQAPPVTFNAFGQPVQQPCIPGQPCETNQALQRRASDRPAAPSGQGGEQQPQGLPACDPAQPYDPTRCDPTKQWDPNAAQQQLQQQMQQPGIPGQSPFPGQPYPGQIPGQGQPYPGQPGAPPTTGPMGYPGVPGFPGGYPGAAPGAMPRPGGGYPQVGAPPVSSQTGGAVGSPFGPGASPGGQNSAIGLINKILTEPRQGGIPGQAGAAAMGPGIVGVATKHEGIGIKVYAERTKYQEWEFVYDPKDEKAPNMGGNQQQQGQPGNNNNPLGGSGNTGSNGSSSSPFGQQQQQQQQPSPFGSGGGMGRQR